MYGVIGEDESDVETIKRLIRSLAGDKSITIKTMGYSSCGEMLRKGYKQLQLFSRLKCTRLVVCYDSDRAKPEDRKKELIDKVFAPAGIDAICCALVPIQEIESWILADIKAVQNVIKGWAPEKEVEHPEHIQDPKEYLEKLSRQNQRPRYIHATHNPAIASYLNLDTVAKRCKSFLPLRDIVLKGVGNIEGPGD